MYPSVYLLFYRKEELLKGIYAMGFNRPSKIQEMALPMMLAHPWVYRVVVFQGGCFGFLLFTPRILCSVYTQSSPLFHSPQNLIAQSQSGTGKTAAFVLAMLSRVNALELFPQVRKGCGGIIVTAMPATFQQCLVFLQILGLLRENED